MRAPLLLALVFVAVAVGAAAVADAAPSSSSSPPADLNKEAVQWFSFCRTSSSHSTRPLSAHAGVVAGCESYGYFNDAIATTGWGYLHVESKQNSESPFAAGFAEGFLTAERIAQNIVNGFASTWPPAAGETKSEVAPPADVVAWVLKQRDYVVSKTRAQPHDAYWQQAHGAYQQLHGMQLGAQLAGFNISFSDLLINSMIAEVGDVQAAVDPTYRASIDVLSMHGDLKRVKAIMFKNSHCSALIRPSPDGSDLFATHTTWTEYAQMLRIYKYYKLNLVGDVPSGNGAGGVGVHFSSYPGSTSSIDDWYTIDSGLIVTETTNNVANVSLYDLVTSSSVPTFARVQIANRMAATGQQWADIFSRENSGTYNNQWMVLDTKQFTPHQPLRAGTLTICSQAPGQLFVKDVTDVVTRMGYWASFNIPYFPELWKLLGYQSLVDQYGANGKLLWDYNGSFRQVLFARDAPKVTNIEGMKWIIRENNWQTDPLSHHSAELAIAARMDLSGGPLQDPAAMGAIDAKISSAALLRSGGQPAVIISGPTTQSQPAFQWSTSAWNRQPHEGMPDRFDFDWVSVQVQPLPKHARQERVATE